jgi:hypothetical protein
MEGVGTVSGMVGTTRSFPVTSPSNCYKNKQGEENILGCSSI